jgi:hypothetical protein
VKNSIAREQNMSNMAVTMRFSVKSKLCGYVVDKNGKKVDYPLMARK